MKEKIRSILEINRIPASPELPEQLEIYLRLLKEWNSKMDLIAEAPDDEILDRHFADSLTVLRTGLIPDDAKWIDVGTGAGFPGLPLAIARPDIRMTLMDAQQKRLNFLHAVIRETGVTEMRLFTIRTPNSRSSSSPTLTRFSACFAMRE